MPRRKEPNRAWKKENNRNWEIQPFYSNSELSVQLNNIFLEDEHTELQINTENPA